MCKIVLNLINLLLLVLTYNAIQIVALHLFLVNNYYQQKL